MSIYGNNRKGTCFIAQEWLIKFFMKLNKIYMAIKSHTCGWILNPSIYDRAYSIVAKEEKQKGIVLGEKVQVTTLVVQQDVYKAPRSTIKERDFCKIAINQVTFYQIHGYPNVE